MEFIPVSVTCHSGYKAEEYPVSFIWNGELYEIEEITDRWYQGDTDPAIPVSDYFKVRASGTQYILKNEVERSEWYMCR